LFGPRILILALLLGTCWAGDTSPDYHLTSDPARYLYASSPFAHGQIHGYEDGFHQADMDIQMGRGEENIQTKNIKMHGYQSEFGKRESFERGYKAGFVRGYEDSWADRPFRAMPDARKYDVVSLVLLPDRDLPDFDRGFQAGYLSLTASNPKFAHQCESSSETAFCTGLKWGGRLAQRVSTASSEPELSTGGER